MSVDPRVALSTFVSALERHLEAAAGRRGEDDPAVVAAYQDVAEAFDRYEDALMDAHGEVTPLEVYSDDDDDDDDILDPDDSVEAEDFDDDGEPYQGLEDEEYDEEDLNDDSPPKRL